ncbi:porin [Massilia sp. 9096]|uniref:porin n=1 Tax=Massilia sp. 9096 TaxID=1500894 RepID=UPI000561C016|nr:porin [Massilia sp. 9096]
MRKTIIITALLGAITQTSFAQSNVTIYGLLDAGIEAERGGAAGNIVKVSSGIASASRLGFKGTEDLGNGLSALFVLESGILIDTGASDVAGQAFNRQAFVGLKSNKLGSVTLGRQYTLTYNALGQVGDPFAAGLAGSAKNLFPVAGANLRANNSIVYSSPTANGFTAEALYSVGEVSGNSTAGRQFNLGLNYASGPLSARLAYNNRNNDTATVTTNSIGHNTLFVANYDFKVAKLFFAYSADKGMNSAPLNNATPRPYGRVFNPSLEGDDLLLGAQIPVGTAGTLITSYIRKNDKTAENQDARQYALGYVYALSKRTSAYASYGMMKNKNGAAYTVGNNSDAGTGDRATNVGVRHSF